MSDLRLDPHERESPLMQKLVEHWQAQLAAARLANDFDNPGRKTAAIRGRIAQLKANIALADPPER